MNSQKIPIDNFDINHKEKRIINFENNNKISPPQKKKRSKIHRHKSYDNLHYHDKQKNNNNYNKINNQKRIIQNINPLFEIIIKNTLKD